MLDHQHPQNLHWHLRWEESQPLLCVPSHMHETMVCGRENPEHPRLHCTTVQQKLYIYRNSQLTTKQHTHLNEQAANIPMATKSICMHARMHPTWWCHKSRQDYLSSLNRLHRTVRLVEVCFFVWIIICSLYSGSALTPPASISIMAVLFTGQSYESGSSIYTAYTLEWQFRWNYCFSEYSTASEVG